MCLAKYLNDDRRPVTCQADDQPDYLSTLHISQVAISYASNVDAARKTVSEIEAHGATAVAICANLLDENMGEQLVRASLAGLETDTIHIVVNNAALADVGGYLKPVFETTPSLVGKSAVGTGHVG
jgi:hypothetical protein